MMKRIAPVAAFWLLSTVLLAGCCDETAEETAVAPAPSAVKETPAAPASPAAEGAKEQPADPVPAKAAKEQPPAPAAKPAAAPAAEPAAEAAEEPAGIDEPPPSDNPLFGKSPEEVEAIQAEQDRKTKALAQTIGVETDKGQWEIGHAGDASTAQIVVAVKEDAGGSVPNFKAGLVRDGKVLGTTSDFAAFTGASAEQLAARRDCSQWGSDTRQDLVLDEKTRAFRVSFWCQKTDGTGVELVTVMAVPQSAASLSDVKRLWTGDGSSLSAAEGDCQSTVTASFRIEGGELVRDYKVTTSPSKPPVEGEAPPEVDCPAPEAPAPGRFPLSL